MHTFGGPLTTANVDHVGWRRGVIKSGGLSRTVPLANGKSTDSSNSQKVADLNISQSIVSFLLPTRSISYLITCLYLNRWSTLYLARAHNTPKPTSGRSLRSQRSPRPSSNHQLPHSPTSTCPIATGDARPARRLHGDIQAK